MDDEQIPWHIFRVLQEEIAAKSPAKWKSFFRKACGKDLAEAKKASRQIQSLEDNISCLIRSVEKRGVEMDEIVAKFDNLNEERVQLRSCIYKRTVLVEGNVQVELAAAIEELRIGLLHKQKNDIWRAQPDKLLDKVILHPITESRTGETIDVQLKPDSWVEFYRMLKIGSYESPSTPCHAVAI
ncbi:MAG: hypothetical protein HRT36_00635 [Alphaproteobacteria bacterium]|nr:hypothetical protein [Alphaproteobacteria bacterium]